MKFRSILTAALAALTALSCAKSAPEPTEPSSSARVVSVTHDDHAGMTICTFEYPSCDPYGHPATLSGVISFGDEINAENRAQASIDALLAAEELLPGLGVKFVVGKNQYFNLGYSQGAQTAIAVLKVAAEKYPRVRFTHSFAGSGPYDMLATFQSMFVQEEAAMPSTVIAALLSFNEYYQLGYPMEELFQEAVIPDVEQYVLSKDYSRIEAFAAIPAQPYASFLQPGMLDKDGPMYKNFLEAFGKETLCSGWVPRQTERIFLSSNPKDDIVPPVNSENLYHFLVEEQGLTGVEWYASEGISTLVPEAIPRHLSAAADYVVRVRSILRSQYGISWTLDFSKFLGE